MIQVCLLACLFLGFFPHQGIAQEVQQTVSFVRDLHYLGREETGKDACVKKQWLRIKRLVRFQGTGVKVDCSIKTDNSVACTNETDMAPIPQLGFYDPDTQELVVAQPPEEEPTVNVVRFIFRVSLKDYTGSTELRIFNKKTPATLTREDITRPPNGEDRCSIMVQTDLSPTPHDSARSGGVR
jgi:hypothetical protein